MEKLLTKERILNEALTLFSKNGYDAVSVAKIADAVGIKPPSLYKHFKSKEDIFNAILSKMTERYEERSASFNMDGTTPELNIELFQHMDENQLTELGKNLFLYFLHDEYISKFRKMLTMEQYHNKELALLHEKQYITDPLSYQGILFGFLIKKGFFVDTDAQIMALQFYAPMYLLILSCECHPEQEETILKKVEQHIRQFNQLYKKEEKK